MGTTRGVNKSVNRLFKGSSGSRVRKSWGFASLDAVWIEQGLRA